MLSIVWSLLPDNDWWALPVFMCKLSPIKAHWGTGSWPFSPERLVTSPLQADRDLVDLFSSVATGEALWVEARPQHVKQLVKTQCWHGKNGARWFFFSCETWNELVILRLWFLHLQNAEDTEIPMYVLMFQWGESFHVILSQNLT